MTLRQLLGLIITIYFLPQPTLAQKPGAVSDSVKCQRSSGQTYALYLPASYTQAMPAGLLLFFDPGARGKMPVGLYKKIADKYSVILACSNNSHNGPVDQSIRAGYAVLEDVMARFNIDRKLIFTSGFSGGGRTAVELAIRDRAFAGVITCGAAMPAPDAIKMEHPVSFAEVIGQLDMNYQEALKANEYLNSIHNPALTTFFYGGHQWPPATAYEDALTWQLKKVDVNKVLRQAQVLIDSGYLYEAGRMLKQRLGAKQVDSMFAVVQKDKRTRPQTKEAERVNAGERDLQQRFFYAYQRHLAYAAPDSAFHPEFWTSFRNTCDRMTNGDRYKKLAGLRLIDYGWRLCAEQHYFFLGEELYRQAAMSARIWALIMPDDPAPCVQAAKAFALQRRKPEMLDYLMQARSRNLKDAKAIVDDPAFSAYTKDADFVRLFR